MQINQATSTACLPDILVSTHFSVIWHKNSPEETGVIFDSVCTATWKQGYEVGQRALSGQAKSKEDVQVMLEAGAFSDQVYDFIIKGTKL
jgi:hypothetical protein